MQIENFKKLVKKGDNILIISSTGLMEKALSECIKETKDFTVYLIENL